MSSRSSTPPKRSSPRSRARRSDRPRRTASGERPRVSPTLLDPPHRGYAPRVRTVVPDPRPSVAPRRGLTPLLVVRGLNPSCTSPVAEVGVWRRETVKRNSFEGPLRVPDRRRKHVGRDVHVLLFLLAWAKSPRMKWYRLGHSKNRLVAGPTLACTRNLRVINTQHVETCPMNTRDPRSKVWTNFFVFLFLSNFNLKGVSLRHSEQTKDLQSTTIKRTPLDALSQRTRIKWEPSRSKSVNSLNWCR